MKNTKRGLSLLVAFALLFTSVGIGLGGAVSMKSGVPKTESLSNADVSFACTFYVPELIYLQASAAANSANTFKYYVDCDTSGNLSNAKADTAGTVYFYCANASAVSISCSGASVTLGSSSGSNTINTTVTAGTLSAGLSQGYTSTLTWTATYTVNGEQKTAKAYTVCYAPQVSVVATAIRTYNDDGTGGGDKADLQAFAWISGVHGCGTGGNYQANTSGSYILAPLLGTVTSTTTNTGCVSWFFAQTNGWTRYHDWSGGNDRYTANINSPTGTLTVDTSRYSNINQIPNLTCGHAITHTGNMDGGKFKNYASNYSPNGQSGWSYADEGTTNNDRQNAIITGYPGYIFWGSTGDVGVTNGVQYNGNMWSQAISSYDNIRLKAAGWGNNNDEYNAYSCLVNVNMTKVDKSTLRSKVRQYTNMGLQAADYSNYAAFESALKSATERLGNPTSSDNSYSALDTAYNNLSRVAYSANIYHRSADGYVYQDEGLTFYSGQTVSFGPNSYTGYTISSASGSTTSTSPQTWYNRRANITVTYTYTPNTNTVYKVNHYKVNVAQNGWDFAEQDTLYGTTNTTVTAPIKTYPGFYVNEEGLTVHTGVVAPDGSLVLIRYYRRNFYNITFNANGGSGGAGPTSMIYGGTLTAPSPGTRTGYTFSNWSPSVPSTVGIGDATYTAQWTANTYTVAYNGNGATGGSTASSAHTYDVAKALTANGFSRTGYTFTGWNTAANGSGTSYSNGQSVTNLTATQGATVTLYAQWTINQYTIYFDEAGGSTVSDITQNYGTTVTPPANPTRTGYTFTGWSPAVPGTMPANNVTCVAQWTINQYTIYFDEAGGSAVSDITQNYGTTVTPPANPTRTGYTFTGWSPAVPGTMPANNTTCVAQWSANTYQVTFNANTGTGSMTPQDIVFNTTEALSSNSFTKTGYTFTGWNTAANGSGTAYANGANFTMNVTGATLYAQWTANTYTVDYLGNGSTGGSTGDSSHTYDVAKNLTANGYTRTGHSFLGWSTSSSATTPTYTDGQSVTNLTSTPGGIVTFYAVWSVNSYTITFDANGGTGGWSESRQYGSALTAPTVTRTGYTFTSWSPAVPSTVPAANSTYTAQWTANTYTVTYNGNGSTGGSTANSAHTYDVAKALTTNGYTRTGYTFAGWATSAGGAVAYTDGQSVTNLSSTQGATVTLYAKWTANTYTVAYNGNGNTGGSTASSSHTYDAAKNLTANGFTKTGYTFAGWNTAANGSGTSYTNSQSVTNLTAADGATVTLYAQWTINQYTIYFDEAGGSTVSDITQNYGTTVTPPANPTRTGYTFTGWSPAVPGTMPANNVTCVAQWTINQYTIYFDEAGGSAVSDITQNYGTTVTPPANPTRTGYTFTGWSPAVPGTMPANNTTCVAQWSANTYQVTFNANTGTGSMTPQDIVFNTTEALSSNSFTKTGYTFTGWNTAANGSGTAYANGANFTMNVTGATLYAQWTANTYTVVYNGNGSTGGTTANSSHTYDTAKNLTTNGYTKTGYTFAGWATSAGGAVAYSDGQSVTNLSSGQGATVTLYAKWTANTYTVAYDGNGNTSGSTADSPHTYDTAKNLTSNGYVKTGYTFTGWNTAANGSGTSYTNGQSVTNLTSTNGATVTLYAQWTANTYTVDYLGNGSTGGTTADSPHTYDLASNLTTNGYTRTGHSFLGWSTSSSATTADYADGQSVTNLTAAPGGVVTFYAVWSANTYQVTFNANGGSGSMAAQNIVYGQSAALTSNGYTKTGHTFTGWATSQANADAGTVAYANGGNFTMNTTGATIYAVWSINSYTITFNANGGTGGWSESRVYNSALTAPAVTRTGYTFTSWSPAVPATVPAANSTYTAQWTANTYTVTYNGNGADGGSTANSSHTYDAAKNLTANGYTKTGYTFAGWNTAADGSGTAYTNSQSVTNLTSVNGATVTLYARWTANTYTVAYDGNGSTGGSTADSAHTYDTAKNLTANGYSKTGYTFAGWNTGANGSGTSYTNGQSVTNLSAVNGATVTLYAQWTANTYTVTYDGNGATGGSTANSSHTYDTAKNLTANGYTKTGHSFEGWAMSSGGAAVYTDAQSVTNLTAVNGATVTLYAVWEPLPADYSAVTAAIALAQAATLPANAANDSEYIPGGSLYEAAEFTNGGWYARSMFSAASLTAMDNAINAVVYGLNSTQQATVDGYAAAIMAAYNNIALDIADYSTLDDLVDEAEAILNDPNPPFTTESLDNLSMNLGYGYDTQAAQYKEPLQEWVDGIATMLSDAIAALVYKPADYTIVNNAWASRPDNLYEYYTAASVDNLVNYYNQQIDWNLTLENNGQATVNGYAAQIYALIAALVLKPADYTIVDNAIKAIPDNDGGLIGIDYDYLATIYTTASIADLTEAVEAVVTGKDISEQGIVDGYAADILDAISGLTPLAADYTFLGLALQNTPPWPGSYYTTATYTDYNDAVVAGQALYNNQNLNITQQQIVDDATADINAAYAALVLKPVTYTVRYTDALGAELSSDVQRDATAADTVTENAISITGYTPRQASIQKQMTGTSSENIFTFVYDINSYTITFNSNGGSAVTAITQNYNTQVQQPADPAKEGNDFAGWYTDAGLTNAVAWPVTLGASNATYYAKWVIKSYTITFDAQGGTVTPESISVNYGGNYGTLPVPEQEGYTFNGWYTQALGGALVENNQAFSANAAQTLYARWTMIPADVEDLEEAVEVNYSPDYVGSLPVTSGDGTVESTVYAYGSAAQRQAVEDAYTAAAALQAESPMPDTAANRGRIAAATEALNDALETLLLYPNPAVYTYVDEEIDEANRINLNRYTIASIDELQTAVDAVVTGKGAIDQAAVNAYAAGMYNHRAGASALVPYTDAKAPKLDVFETTEAMQAGGVTVSGFDPEDFGDVSYVYPGKAYYTYYCYTNSETPAILVNIADTADGNGRISYPTEMAVSSVSGTVNAGWMNYTYDGGTRAGTVTQSSMTVNDTRYADYTVGMNYDTLGEEYYKQAGCLVLKPEFVRSGGKQFAKYTISGTDDAGENANAADTTSLAGGTAAWQAGKPITTTNANVTPAGTITIYVEYRNSMSYEDGTYYDDGRAANSIRAYNNLGAEGTWVNKDYFYRVSGGATNDEIIKRNDTVYNAMTRRTGRRTWAASTMCLIPRGTRRSSARTGTEAEPRRRRR